MQDAFGIVIVVVVAVSAVIAVVTLFGTGRTYRQIGRGGLSIDEERGRDMRPPQASPAALAQERDDEIRQMLTARNARRERLGRETVDVEDELAQLTRPAAAPADPGLVDEVRQLVVARNSRRAGRGQPPLDVEAEVERRLRELGAS